MKHLTRRKKKGKENRKEGLIKKRFSRIGNELRDSRTGLRTVKHSRVVSLETKNEAVI